MKKKPSTPPDAAELRRRAEVRVRESKKGEAARSRTKEEMQRLLHELQVHQIELEMQNEELQTSRAQVEKLKDRYSDFYDFSPTGFVSLERNGAIIQINLTGARLLGRERARLAGDRFELFVAMADRPVFNAFLQQVFAIEAKQTCEVALAEKDRPPIFVQIEATLSPDKQECRAVVEDITERKRAEEALRRSEETAKRLAQENAIMAEIGRIISSTLNIEEVYERFAEEVHKLISFDRIAINIINPQDQTFTVAYVTGTEIEERRQGNVIPLAGSATQEATRLRSGSIIQIVDEDEITARVPTYLPSFRAGFRLMMTIPLISKNQVIAILHLQSIKPNAYTERDLRIAERVGHQVAGAIANAQLFIERKRAEEEHRTILRTAMDGFWITDMKGHFLDVNDAYCRLIGYSRDELLTMSISDVEAVERPEETAQHIQKIKKTGGDRFETRHRCKGGRIVDVEISVNYIDAGGGRLFVFARDITERKRAEEALKMSKELFEKTFISQLDALFLLDAIIPPTILDCNPAATKIFGHTREEMVGRTMNFLYVDEADLKEFQRHLYSSILEHGLLDLYEFRMRRKDGTVFPTEHSVVPLEDNQGTCFGWVSMVRDITEPKRVEKELIERGMFNFALFHYNPIQTIVVDLEGKVTGYNRAKRESGDRLPNIGDVMYRDYAKGHEIDMYAEMMECIRSGKIREFPEQKYHDKVLSITISPFPKGAVIISQDITERKRAEEKIRTYQEQLRSLVTELSLVEDQERRRIATDLHDNIGQALAMAKIKLGALRGKESSMDLARPVDEIRKLIEQAIQYTRSLIFDLSPPILYELGFEAAVEWLTEQIQEQYGILIDFEDDRQHKPMNEKIRILLFRALKELLINVVKHAQAHKAKVSIRREDNNIRIGVEDDGVGFDTSKMDYFIKTGAFGLFNIRESMRGCLEIQSEPGQGTRITLVTPLM